MGGCWHYDLSVLLVKNFRGDGVERLAEVHKQGPDVRPCGVVVMHDLVSPMLT